VINEFMPNPVGTEPDNEWIEIYNNDTVSVNITDWKLGDPRENYTISVDVISSRGFRVYYGNDTGIQLSNIADTVLLYNSTGALVDSKSYNSTTENSSYMRLPDGGPWVPSNSTSPPTPGWSNTGMRSSNILLEIGWNLISLPLVI